MHMLTMDQLLARVVERKGYHVQGADSEGLLARKGEESLLVAWKTDGPLTADEALMFTTAMEQVHATTGILVAPKGAEQVVKDQAAATKGLELWAESRLVVEVGEAFVKDALGVPGVPVVASPTAPATYPTNAPAVGSGAGSAAPTHGVVRPGSSLIARAATAASGNSSGAVYFMPNKPKAPPAAHAQAVADGKPLNYAFGAAAGYTPDPGIAQVRNGRKPHRAEAATAAAPADVEIVETPKKNRASSAAVAVHPPATATPTKVAHDDDAYEIITTPKKSTTQTSIVTGAAGPDTLKASLDRPAAEAKASAKVGAVKGARLTWIPHVAFDYDACIERPQLPEPITGKGTVLVSSLSGALRVIPGMEFAEAPADAKKETPKMTAVDVYDKVKGHLGKEFSRELKVAREVAGNEVFENVKIHPGPDELGLNHRGIVYVPIWEIQGANGAAKVDAASGDVL